MKFEVKAKIKRSQGFSLDVAIDCESQALGIVGESGSGKSTLLDMISGVVPGARVELDGRDLSSLPVHQREFGYVAQDALLFPHMRVRENLQYSPRAGADMDGIVGALGIGHLLERYPRNLSGGEKRRASLARALLSQPKLLLLDEPFAGLDEDRRRAAASLLNQMRARFGIPMILVSHLASEVMSLTDYALRLEAGEIVAQGPSVRLLGESDMRVDNFLHGRVVGKDRVRVGDVEFSVMLPDDMLGEIRLVCYAHDVMLAGVRPQEVSSRNIFQARVKTVESAGSGVLVELDSPPMRAFVTHSAVESMNVSEGAELFALIKATSILPLA